MQPPNNTDPSEALMEVWRLVKPSEAKDLKVMVASADGRFAGIFSCDADQHGDRFFVLKEKPRSKTWTMASNLMSLLEDLTATSLTKAARQSINEFREIFANPSVTYEPSIDPSNPSKSTSGEQHKPITPSDGSAGKSQPSTSHPGSSAASVNQPSPQLRGKQLVARAKQLEGHRPEELAQLCGYVIVENGKETGDIESYYAALFDAHSA